MILSADSEGCVDVQTDLGLRFPHMSEDTFLSGAAKTIPYIHISSTRTKVDFKGVCKLYLAVIPKYDWNQTTL